MPQHTLPQFQQVVVVINRGANMKYPLVLCCDNSLIIAPEEFFEGIGYVNEASKIMKINVKQSCQSGFRWFLDGDGFFMSWNRRVF